VFAPKPAQRILAIRTEPATEADHHRSLELAGRVIPDPNASGFVQTAVGGRLSAPEGGFPSLGATVTAGQVLAIVEPSLAAIDQSSIRQAQAELDQEIAIAERQVERFRKLSASGALSQTQLEEAEINLTGLRERRAALDDVKLGAENLVAPISGVIASANAAQGLIAETNTIVFHIVDPARLWIEAISYSGDDVAQAASVSDGVDGAILLGFAGAGFADGSQAQPVLFRIEDEDSTLRLGQMVTVVAATSAAITGIAMPRDAVIRGTNGEYIVYVHTSPEMFEPRPVRMEPLDGAQVLIVAGVAPGDRVVTQGAELLNQLR
jgi:RND family efflux transporter MFP subunit